MIIEAMKLMVEAIEADLKLFNIPATARMLEALNAGRQAIAEAEKQEPVALRRGDILRCIETDDLCTVWATSTTGKTLVYWGGNDFDDYTAEQIGELFWVEPKAKDLEDAAERSDNYAAFHAGVRYANTHPQPKREPLTDEQILNLARGHYSPHQRPEISFARAIEAAHGIKGEA